MKNDKELDLDFFKKNEKHAKMLKKNQRYDAIEKALKNFLFAHLVLTVLLISLNFFGITDDMALQKSLEMAKFVN